jgi:hypothetical protein
MLLSNDHHPGEFELSITKSRVILIYATATYRNAQSTRSASKIDKITVKYNRDAVCRRSES